MASNFSCAEIPESPPLQDRLDSVRAFSRGANLNLVRTVLDTGILLVRTAQRLDPGKEAYANCLKAARKCGDDAARDLWRLRHDPDVFIRLTNDIERLGCEITALSQP